MNKSLTITAPARIHIGFLDLEKKSMRKFGSIGLTISDFYYKIKIEKFSKIRVICENKLLKDKIINIIKKFQLKYSISQFKITVLNEIPIHNGLGSGTQLALSLGYLISKFNNLDISIDQISNFLNRGLRSGVGIQSFKKGGFNIDVGKLVGSPNPPLNILNLKWPREWKILLILDKNLIGVHGKKEIEEFKELEEISLDQSNLTYKALVMNIIPGLIEQNFNEFAKGVRIIQENMSRTFHGGINKFASKNVEKIFLNLKKYRIKGFGQSSWGPTGFLFFENSKKRNQLLKHIENYINLKNIFGIQLLKVGGRNFGKKIFTKEML